MSNYYESAPDQFITIKGILYAYRRFGKEDGVPLFLHMHFRGTMDHWDPAFINPLATARPIIIFDSAGVGRSEGEIPVTFASWAKMALDFFEALGLKEVDVFGFSMGGCTAQLIALNAHKGLVRKLVLAGTVPSGGEGVVRRNPPTEYNVLRLAKTKDEQHHAFLISFFSKSEKSQAEGQAAWERIQNARSHPVDYIEVETAKRQSVASQSFYDLEKTGEGSYNRLHELTIPVLIANGNNDLLLPTDNSILIFKKLTNAQAELHLYPDSGHGFLYQYADQFTKLMNDFLDRPRPGQSSKSLVEGT